MPEQEAVSPRADLHHLLEQTIKLRNRPFLKSSLYPAAILPVSSELPGSLLGAGFGAGTRTCLVAGARGALSERHVKSGGRKPPF